MGQGARIRSDMFEACEQTRVHVTGAFASSGSAGAGSAHLHVNTQHVFPSSQRSAAARCWSGRSKREGLSTAGRCLSLLLTSPKYQRLCFPLACSLFVWAPAMNSQRVGTMKGTA